MRFRSLIFACVFVTAFVYLLGRPNSYLRRVMPSSVPLFSEPDVALSAGLGADELNNIDVYKSSKDAVVYITTKVVQRTFFFTQEGQAIGSGFIINAEGQILTNFHVVNGPSDPEVMLPDGSNYRAKILVRDRQDDLALIQIEPRKKIPHLNLGDSDRL